MAATARRVGSGRVPSMSSIVGALLTALARHVVAVETVVRISGVIILCIAVGAWDWRVGLALAGISLILSTIELPRRTS